MMFRGSRHAPAADGRGNRSNRAGSLPKYSARPLAAQLRESFKEHASLRRGGEFTKASVGNFGGRARFTPKPKTGRGMKGKLLPGHLLKVLDRTGVPDPFDLSIREAEGSRG